MEVLDKILSEGLDSVTEEEYRGFVQQAMDVLEEDNVVRKDWSRYVVIGDTHGDLSACQVPSDMAIQEGLPMIFLGDYIDRGRRQLENLAYVLDLKLERPDDVVLLRGNHETQRMNTGYGFLRVVRSYYSQELYEEISNLYRKLPISSVIHENRFLVHGGIPEGVEKVDEIDKLSVEDQRYEEMMWNDPQEGLDSFSFNRLRGGYKVFGRGAVDDFLESNCLSGIIRAHQCFPDGYKYFFDERLLTVFSVPNYCSNPNGKFAVVDEGEEEIELYDI